MRATLRFHDALNDFVSPAQRGKEIAYDFVVPGSVKDIIEASGVPHPEVGRILKNAEPTSFKALVQDGDCIDVYPCTSEAQEPSAPLPCFPSGRARFVADVHLATLAGYLRLLGMDVLYRNDYTDEQLASISSTEDRVLLTRDVGLLKRSMVRLGYFLRSTDPVRQMQEVVRRYELREHAQPFTRCLRCNGPLRPVPKEAIVQQLPEHVARTHTEFKQCEGCGRVYWEGSHTVRMRQLVDQALS